MSPSETSSQGAPDQAEATTPDGEGKRSSKFAKWIVLGVVVVLLGGAGVWFLVDSGSKRDVPDLVGSDYASAEALLADSGPQLSATPSDLIENIPGEFIEIITQDIEPDTRINYEEVIEVTVEPMEVSVPDVVGLSLSQAVNDLEASGLLVDRVNSTPENPSEQAVDAMARWDVTDQSIQTGENLDAGSGLILSVEIPDVTVPDLQSETNDIANLESAQSSFETSASGVLSRELLEPIFQGTGFAPLSMSPAPDESVPAFTEVTVTLGVPMPDIVDDELSSDDAIEKLESLGFTNITRANEDDTVVTGQNVEAGEIIATDAEITLENEAAGYIYRISSDDASAGDVTWSDPGRFNMRQANGTSLPWEMEFDPELSGEVQLSGFLSESGTEITCQVLIDGVVVEESTSTGPYAGVHCDLF